MIYSKDVKAAEVLDNPSVEELRSMARPGEWTTKYTSPAYASRVRSRSAQLTKTSADHGLAEADLQAMRDVRKYLEGRRLIRMDRWMGMDPGTRFHCCLYIPDYMARVALMWGKSMFPDPALSARQPDFVLIDVPEWERRCVLVEPNEGFTYVLGLDYFGEVKKGFLRKAMYYTKMKRGGLGLHAGSKVLRVREGGSGRLVERGALFFGLSGTGKTSLTCHPHDLTGEETVEILQDDVVMMQADGSCMGTEDGFYIKTEGLNEKDQPFLWAAATTPNAILENVWVEPDRSVLWDDGRITKNGRGIVLRSEVPKTSHRVDLPRCDLSFFITRNTSVVPALARLDPAQGAAAFMLGESIKTSAADPKAQGEPVREVGTNPFIIGPLAEEGNRYYEIARRAGFQTFLLNTGKVGHPGGVKISLAESQALIREVARGTVKWAKDPFWGYEVAVEAPGIDFQRLDPRGYYGAEEYDRLNRALADDRSKWLRSFQGLHPDILAAFPAL